MPRTQRHELWPAFSSTAWLSPADVAKILRNLTRLLSKIDTSAVINPNESPEALADRLRPSKLQPEAGAALQTVVQVLLQIGPVLTEWRTLGFAGTYELPRRVINRLNLISDQIEKIAGQCR